MKKIITTLFVLLIGTSCSTLNRAKVVGAISGAVISGTLGVLIAKETSPNRQSDGVNKVIGGGVGAILGAWGGVKTAEYFWGEDPENQELSQMILKNRESDNSIKNIQKHEGFYGTPSKAVIYTVEHSNEIPEHLKELLKKQVLTEYVVDEEVYEIEEGQTMVRPAHTVYKYSLEESK